MTRGRTTTLVRTAYHEAGHAVASVLLRQRVRRVSIIANEEEGTLGHMLNYKFRKGFAPDVELTPAGRLQLEKAIMICWAGVTAEARVAGGRHNWRGAAGDQHDAVDYADYVVGDPQECAAYLEWLRRRTENLFKHPARWAAVEALAHALLEHQQLGERDTRTIIINALEAHVPEIPVRSVLVNGEPITIGGYYPVNALEMFRPRLA